MRSSRVEGVGGSSDLCREPDLEGLCILKLDIDYIL
jgi:hypothetical protein